MWTALLTILVLVAGCELPKVRCEYVPQPSPVVSKERQAKLNELADLQVDIDLAIAREDKTNIDIAEGGYEGARKIFHEAQDQRAKNTGQLLRTVVEENENLDKVLEAAARHRCSR
jgi:flagellar basal body L-ring protein FlgH